MYHYSEYYLTIVVAPSALRTVKVPESNEPLSLLIHSNSTTQSVNPLIPFNVHFASPFFTQEDLQRKKILKIFIKIKK